MSSRSLPLFPLHTVLFPGGLLPLRVFERRYIDLVTRCLRNNEDFGICLISAGREVGQAAECFSIGTTVRIQDWGSTADGLLAVTVRGELRFRILNQQVEPDQLTIAEVELLNQPPRVALPIEHAPLSRLLEHLLDELEPPYRSMPRELNDADWVSGRLTELLPLDSLEKQTLLEEMDPLARLSTLSARLGR